MRLDEPQTCGIADDHMLQRNAEVYRRQAWNEAIIHDSGEELGKGIYVTDRISDAKYYADMAVGFHEMDTGESLFASICTVFAESAAFLAAPKVYIPQNILQAGNAGGLGTTEAWAIHAEWIASNLFPPGTADQLSSQGKLDLAATFIKLSSEDSTAPEDSHNQMLIPVALIPSLRVAECIDYPVNGDLPQPFSRPQVSDLEYRVIYHRQEWVIRGNPYNG
ncbi:hypothetical protein HGRIS_004400 [Hohenbuehelia grisea]|uniref:Uncharacterized protein n=1 Tax=Hohenbuehelia grisea TaxID=104357 RepID=A0ABR3JCD8_9AGAR